MDEIQLAHDTGIAGDLRSFDNSLEGTIFVGDVGTVDIRTDSGDYFANTDSSGYWHLQGLPPGADGDGVPQAGDGLTHYVLIYTYEATDPGGNPYGGTNFIDFLFTLDTTADADTPVTLNITGLRDAGLNEVDSTAAAQSVRIHLENVDTDVSSATVTLQYGPGFADYAIYSLSPQGTDFNGDFYLTLPTLPSTLRADITTSVRMTDTSGNVTTREGDAFTATFCFMPGTMIATPDGEVAVETLRIGDLVMTASGAAQPVRWMGRQAVSTRFADPLRTLPIRIQAGALGQEMPLRDLLVSPDHALLLEGLLVHAGALVNGSTITRATALPVVFTYHHVELADHSLVLAEGTPAETFVDNVNRMAFDNWAEHQALYAHLPPLMELDLPRAKSARQLPMALRRRLAERATALLGQVAAAA